MAEQRKPVVGVEYSAADVPEGWLPDVRVSFRHQDEHSLVLQVETAGLDTRADASRLLSSVADVLMELHREAQADEDTQPLVMEPTHMPFNPQPRQGPGGR